MIKIYGQIDSLKKIRSILNERGITEFNSIKEINTFLNNYNDKIEELLSHAGQELEEETEKLKNKKISLESKIESIINQVNCEAKSKLERLSSRLLHQKSRNNTSIFNKILNITIRYITKLQIQRNEFRRTKSIKKATDNLKSQLAALSSQLTNYSTNKADIIKQKIAPQIERINHIKQAIQDINPLIAGAIGEYKVVKELGRLSKNGFLINDFKLAFNPPLYYKVENTKIQSVQIDHLLITQSGIYILESKNWSKQSIENLDLRSPVDQINRSSYALYRLLNDMNKLSLKSHHWGDKEIPIRNIVVMINNKPNVKFKHVKIKRLKELNSYIEHFESTFDDEEILRIVSFLRQHQQDKQEELINQSNMNNNVEGHHNKTVTINDLYKERWS